MNRIFAYYQDYISIFVKNKIETEQQQQQNQIF
jgi:hypothetical protein